ncbi:hypothetical protein ACVWXL_000139 [Bradyrhizobium sp. GM22.5]
MAVTGRNVTTETVSTIAAIRRSRMYRKRSGKAMETSPIMMPKKDRKLATVIMGKVPN